MRTRVETERVCDLEDSRQKVSLAHSERKKENNQKSEICRLLFQSKEEGENCVFEF